MSGARPRVDYPSLLACWPTRYSLLAIGSLARVAVVLEILGWLASRGLVLLVGKIDVRVVFFCLDTGDELVRPGGLNLDFLVLASEEILVQSLAGPRVA